MSDPVRETSLSEFHQVKKAVFAVNVELETALDAGLGEEWAETRGRKAQPSAALGCYLYTGRRSLIIAQELLLAELNAKTVSSGTVSAHGFGVA